MAKQKKISEERTRHVADIEAGVAAFQALQSSSEVRNQSLISLFEPYRDSIRAALERGVSKKAVLDTLNTLIGHSLNAKKLDELLGGGTLRSRCKSGASSLIKAGANQALSREGA